MTPRIEQLLAELEKETNKEKVLLFALTAKPDGTGNMDVFSTSNAKPENQVYLLEQLAEQLKAKQAQKRKTTKAQNNKPSTLH